MRRPELPRAAVLRAYASGRRRRVDERDANRAGSMWVVQTYASENAGLTRHLVGSRGQYRDRCVAVPGGRVPARPDYRQSRGQRHDGAWRSTSAEIMPGWTKEGRGRLVSRDQL